MSTADWVEYLKISTMIFFHIFILVAVVGTFYALVVLSKIQTKVNQTLEKADGAIESVKEAAWSVSDAGTNLADFISPMIFRRRSKSQGIWSIISKFLG